MESAEFKRVVQEALARLPQKLRRKIENVQIVVRDARRPKRRPDAPDERELYGLYTGTPFPQRRDDDPARLPDTVILFKNVIEKDFEKDRPGMIRCIQDTVLHELGHYFGFDDEDLEKLGIG